jgi:hypothetical protein
MKKVTKYEDNNGKAWDTEKEALTADAMMVVTKVVTKVLSSYTSDSDIDAERLVKDLKYSMTDEGIKFVEALLYVLDIDDTKLAVQRINRRFSNTNKEDIGE